MNTEATKTTNQTAFEDKVVSKTAMEKIVDLTVDDETSGEIKGGPHPLNALCAIQKVR